MPFFPFRKIFVGRQYTLAIAGNHIQVISTTSGAQLCSVPASATLITGADVAWSQERIVTTGEDKMLKVWKLEASAEDSLRLELESSREIPKKSSEVHVTTDGLQILASDKSGDIYSYPMIYTPPSVETVAAPTDDKKAKSAEDKPRFGTLVLGHTSVITSFLLTPGNDFVISGDRDEHIRVSWFPMGYVVERFCMGHLKYVSALHLPSFSESILVSGGGDADIFVWNWKTGALLQRIPVMETVKPLMRVRGGRRNFVRLPRRPDGQGLSRKSRRGKGQRERQQSAQARSQDGTPGVDREDEAEVPAEVMDETAEATPPQPLDVTTEVHLPHKFDPSADSFVIAKIGSTKVDGLQLIIFTAVGASGIFYFPLADEPGSINAIPPVQYLELTQPILDFAVSEGQPGEIWVSVDAAWRDDAELPITASSEDADMVKLVRWVDGHLHDVSNEPSVLFKGLNASHVEAPPSMLDSLELYAALALLPKSQEEEAEDSGDVPAEGTTSGATPDVGDLGESSTSAVRPNRKAVKKLEGRLKTKERLLQHQESATLAPTIAHNDRAQGVASPQPKKVKTGDTEA